MMIIVSQKGTNMSFLTQIVLEFLSPSLKEQVNLCCEHGIGVNIAFENLQ